MGLKDCVKEKIRRIDVKTEQMKAEIRRRDLKKTIPAGSLRDCYNKRMSPSEVFRMKKNEYLRRKHEKTK